MSKPIVVENFTVTTIAGSNEITTIIGELRSQQYNNDLYDILRRAYATEIPIDEVQLKFSNGATITLLKVAIVCDEGEIDSNRMHVFNFRALMVKAAGGSK